jgi:UDP-N-acetylmuramate--alanine ligase
MPVVLNLPGEHNVLNAWRPLRWRWSWALTIAARAARAGQLQGVGGVFSVTAICQPQGGGHSRWLDDYGHHPVEMAATLAAARGAFPGPALVLAFQPHRYTRTRDCFEDFIQVLGRPMRCC